MNDSRPHTIFCDIDGTLVKHNSPTVTGDPNLQLEVLPGTIEKLLEWDRNGYNIILVTGRRESQREATEQQLRRVGIFYDKLIMGIGGGKRIVINDKKPDLDHETCQAISLTRNQGIKNVELG